MPHPVCTAGRTKLHCQAEYQNSSMGKREEGGGVDFSVLTLNNYEKH